MAKGELFANSLRGSRHAAFLANAAKISCCVWMAFSCQIENPAFQVSDSIAGNSSEDSATSEIDPHQLDSAQESSSTGESSSETVSEEQDSSDSSGIEPLDTSGTTDSGADSSAIDSTSTDSTEDSGTSAVSPDLCTQSMLIAVEEGFVQSPMVYSQNTSWSTTPVVWVDDSYDGWVGFDFESSCASDLYAWAYVFDYLPGASQSDADSFYVSLDENFSISWIYGCDSGDEVSGFSWRKIRYSSDDWSCPLTTPNWTIEPGSHTLWFFPRELANGASITGLAQIFLTSDPSEIPQQRR
jgi:hypothetical protein